MNAFVCDMNKIVFLEVAPFSQNALPQPGDSTRITVACHNMTDSWFETEVGQSKGALSIK